MDSLDDNISYVDVTELFVTGDTPAGGSDVTSTIGKIDSPIKDLKIVVLSLDWEITDKTMQNFAEEIDRLEEMWAADKILIAFLKILRALGQYIAKKKARAHPSSVKLLYSVYNALEKVVLTVDMPGAQKKEIVAEELRKYTKLKKQFDIASSSADKPGKVEESEIVTRDKEVAAPDVEMAPAVQPLPQPLTEQVSEPEAAVDEEPVVEAIPVVEGDKTPAALDVEEMDEQMETEVVGLDIPTAGKASGPMEDEICEVQPLSPADELPAKTHLGPLDKKGGEAEPSSQTKEIIPKLSKEISFAEIDNRLDEFFDEEPAEAEHAEAGDEAVYREIKAPAVERVEKETMPPAEEIPAKENIEESVVPLVVSEKAGEAAAATLEVDSRLDDMFGEGDEIPVPDEPEEQAVSIPLEDKTVEPEIEEEPVLLEVPGVELQVEDLLVDEVKVPASEAGKKVTPEDEAELKLMEEEGPPAVAIAEEEVSAEDAVVPLAMVSEKAGEAAAATLEVDSRLDDMFGEGDEIPVPDESEEQAVSIPLEDKTVEPEIEEEPVLFKEPVEETRQEAVAPPPLEVPEVELQVEDLLVDEVKVPASETGKKVTPEDEAELKLELMEEEELPAVAVAEEEISAEDAVIPFEFEDEYRDEEREEKGEEVAVDSVEEFSVPTAALMESLEKFISSSINGDADQQTMEDFSQEIRNAKDAWQDEPEITMFLNIMNSLGKNVTLPVKDAALNSVTLLRSVISSMEVALSSHDETRADTRKILFREMNKYIQHQEQLIFSAISTHPADVEQVSEKEPVPPPVPEYELAEQVQVSETEESSYEEEIEEENGAILLSKSKRALPGFLEKLKNLFR